MYELALRYYIYYAILMAGISFYSIRLFSSRNYLKCSSTKTSVVLFFLLLLLIVFCATGDYWSYRSWYELGIDNLHFEPIWDTIRSIIPWGFDLFKVVLWGGGLVLFTIMCKWHKSDLLISYSLFGLFYISSYSYARASVAFMLILFAYYLFVKLFSEHFKHFPFILLLIVLCIWIGIQMHRSMPILLAILALSFFIPTQKTSFIILLFLFPIASVIFNTILYPFIVSFIASDVDTARLMDVYLHEDTRGIVAFIRQLINHLPCLLLFFVSIYHIMKDGDSSPVVKRIAMSAFLMVYIAFVFYTLREGNGLVLFYRTINMAYPFMLMSIAFVIKYVNNMYKLTFILVIYQILLTILLAYQVLSNPDYLYNQVLERYYL